MKLGIRGDDLAGKILVSCVDELDEATHDGFGGLRRRVSELMGYTRPMSDGSLYPAIKRLAAAGLLERRADPVGGAARYVLNVTAAGRADLLKRLRTPADHEGDRPLRAKDKTDPYRRGMLLTARAINSAERTWLHQVLDGDRPTATRAETDPPTLENPSADRTRR